MNEFDGLRPDDNALRLFFAKDTLYADSEKSPEPQVEEDSIDQEDGHQNPATLLFEGSFSSDFLMIFYHAENKVLFGEWGDMVTRLIENPQALNLSKENICLVNRQQCAHLSFPEFIAVFPAKRILFWGKTHDELPDEKPVYTFWENAGKSFLKVEAPEFYFTQPKSRMELLTQIKTKLL